jgi:hypothetical protein
MTDTASPITEPHLTPMFATGEQPAVSSNTEPTASPIFDTGPHPEPLRETHAESDAESGTVLEWDSDEWAALGSQAAESQSASSEASGLDASGLDYEREPVWDAGSPESEPELARIARGLESAVDVEPEPADPDAPAPKAFSEYDNVDTDAFLRAVTGHLQPVAVPAQPTVVPGSFQFVKRWKFALIVAGVWVVAAAAGAGFYYWWYTALDKTLPVFGILMYLIVCMVASMLVSMVPNRPQVTALAVALMGGPLASTAAAAVLHGAYYFEWIARPIVG